MADKVFKLPVLSESGDNYEMWKRDIKLWCYASALTTRKQAIAIHLSLSGKARVATSELKLLTDTATDPVDQIFEKLDGLFLAEKGIRQFNAFSKLFNLKREDGCSVPDFITKFEHLVYEFKTEDMELPDTVMAFMLLSLCKLTDSDAHLVMSGQTEVTYKGMRAALLRIFGHSFSSLDSSNSSDSVGCVVKSEQVLYAESSESADTYFAGGSKRDGSVVRGRGRSQNSRNSERTFSGNRGGRGYIGNRSARRQNPIGPDGKVSTCAVCSSTMHWIRDCPHSYEKAEGDKEKAQPDSSSVSFSMFAGCTDVKGSSRLQSIVDELEDLALIDSGCANTVCGERWLTRYIDGLTEFQRAQVKEKEGSQMFTFGDGKSVLSKRKITLPCVIGGIPGEITTYVVSCDIPLLLSIKSLRMMSVVADFGQDKMWFMGKEVHLKRLQSGHVALPLSL